MAAPPTTSVSDVDFNCPTFLTSTSSPYFSLSSASVKLPSSARSGPSFSSSIKMTVSPPGPSPTACTLVSSLPPFACAFGCPVVQQFASHVFPRLIVAARGCRRNEGGQHQGKRGNQTKCNVAGVS